MVSYILKKENKTQDILLYQEKNSYSFTPKGKHNKIKKITVLDSEMISSIWKYKITKDYNRLIKIVYSLLYSDDTTSGDVLVAYTEINRIKEYLINLEQTSLDKRFIEKYLKKLYILELELKKVHVMELKEEIEEERSCSR